jgi:hypothetical protein
MQQLSQVQDKLERLDNDKLIKIVKNYKQYGYDESVRNYTLALLETRGVTVEDLRLTGNLENQDYKSSERILQAFFHNSKAAFMSYIILVGLNLAVRLIRIESEGLGIAMTISSIVILIVYLIFLLQSFSNQSNFYKSIGEDYSNGAIIYLLVGMPLYVIMYFIFAREMREKMQAIQ